MEILVSGKKYGLEIVKASNGQVKRGTVYVLLNRMKEKGLVDSITEDPVKGQQGSPRKIYHLTGLGEKARHAYQQLNSDLEGVAETT